MKQENCDAVVKQEVINLFFYRLYVKKLCKEIPLYQPVLELTLEKKISIIFDLNDLERSKSRSLRFLKACIS